MTTLEHAIQQLNGREQPVREARGREAAVHREDSELQTLREDVTNEGHQKCGGGRRILRKKGGSE